MSNPITNNGQIQAQADNFSIQGSPPTENKITIGLLICGSISVLAFGIIFGSIPLLLCLGGAMLIGAIITALLNYKRTIYCLNKTNEQESRNAHIPINQNNNIAQKVESGQSTIQDREKALRESDEKTDRLIKKL